MESWGFLTNHARVLLCIARDPGVRLRIWTPIIDEVAARPIWLPRKQPVDKVAPPGYSLTDYNQEERGWRNWLIFSRR